MKMMHMVQTKIPKQVIVICVFKKLIIREKNENCHRHDNDLFKVCDDQQSILLKSTDEIFAYASRNSFVIPADTMTLLQRCCSIAIRRRSDVAI